ncbi:uncharacterized protein METZ01_LOCUS342299, partial [marine metagenome]
TAPAVAPAHRASPFPDRGNLRDLSPTRRRLHAGPFQNRRRGATSRPVRRRRQPFHAAEFGQRYHPRHDHSHDGRLPVGELPLRQRHGSLAPALCHRASPSSQWIYPRAGKAGSRYRAGHEGGGATRGTRAQIEADLHHRQQIRQRGDPVHAPGSEEPPFHGAPGLEPHLDADELRGTVAQRLLGRRRLGRVQRDDGQNRAGGSGPGGERL